MYRTLPSRLSPASSPGTIPITLAPSHCISLDVVLSRPKTPIDAEESAAEDTSPPMSLISACKDGTDLHLDVMMPDRSVKGSSRLSVETNN